MKFLLSLLIVLVSSNSFAVTVGIVNMQKVINEIKEGKAIIKTLEKSFNKMKAELKSDENKVTQEKEKLGKQDMVLSEKAKITKQQNIQKMMMELQRKTVTYQKKIQQQEIELKEPILKKLKDVVEEVSAKEGVDFTLEIASPLIYAKSKKDLTDAVVKAYDKKHSKK